MGTGRDSVLLKTVVWLPCNRARYKYDDYYIQQIYTSCKTYRTHNFATMCQFLVLDSN